MFLCSGAIMQVGTPFEIYYEPTCLFSGKFVGESNILEGKIQEINGEKAYLETGTRKTRCGNASAITGTDYYKLVMRLYRSNRF